MGRRLIASLLSAFLLALCGCWVVAAGAVGAAAATYYAGKVEQTLDAPVPRTYEAALAALEGQGLHPFQKRSDKVSAHVEAEYADGKHVWITMEAVGAGATKVTVRVGIVPDKDRAFALMAAIQDAL